MHSHWLGQKFSSVHFLVWILKLICTNFLEFLIDTLISFKNELYGLNKIKAKFILKSPIDGKIKNFNNLSSNQWVSNLDELLGIVKSGPGSVVGFLNEENIDRFKIELFYHFF